VSGKETRAVAASIFNSGRLSSYFFFAALRLCRDPIHHEWSSRLLQEMFQQRREEDQDRHSAALLSTEFIQTELRVSDD